MYPVELVAAAGFDAFFIYLNGLLKGNGALGVYFQPLAIAQSHFPQGKEDSFRAGADVAIGQSGWRRTWIMRDFNGDIAGHIDLRGHQESGTGHRCVLGMGVHPTSRKQGLGTVLMAHAERWAHDAGFQWLDLQVLSCNKPALALYERCDFFKTGEIPDMFVLDGQPFSYTFMTKNLQAPR